MRSCFIFFQGGGEEDDEYSENGVGLQRICDGYAEEAILMITKLSNEGFVMGTPRKLS
jgi:hypothetical protein